MSVGELSDENWVDRWDRLYEVLAAEPRREILITLADAPKEQRLPLPDAAASPNQSMDAEQLELQLRHRHLPKLADAGYVRWADEPFCVQRGPQFSEAEFVVNTLLESVGDMPRSLIDNCQNLLEMTESDRC